MIQINYPYRPCYFCHGLIKTNEEKIHGSDQMKAILPARTVAHIPCYEYENLDPKNQDPQKI